MMAPKLWKKKKIKQRREKEKQVRNKIQNQKYRLLKSALKNYDCILQRERERERERICFKSLRRASEFFFLINNGVKYLY